MVETQVINAVGTPGDIVQSSPDQKYRLVKEVEPGKWEVESVQGPYFLSQQAFEYERLGSIEEVRARIQQCEGQHVQQAIFSTFMDTLTQVCFTEQKVRSTIAWEGNRSWTTGSQ